MLAVAGYAPSAARAGATDYCINAVRLPGKPCKSPTTHTFDDNWVFSNLRSHLVCGYLLNPSTGTIIDYFCDYDRGPGVYESYRANAGLYLFAYVQNGSSNTTATLKGNARF